MTETLVIDLKYNGPPSSGHGGYVSGVLARLLGANPAEVTLRLPPPLGRPLALERESGGIQMYDGEAMVAEGLAAEVEIAVPAPVSFDEAEDAAAGYPGLKHHPFPTCLVCGPMRQPQDGFRIFGGPVGEGDTMAAAWTPPGWSADDSGLVRPEFVWAALDCPGGWSLHVEMPGRHAVLGRIAAKLVAPVTAGEQHVVMSWPLAFEGRKGYAGSALFTEAGVLCAVARAAWIRIDRE
ncbi:MAG TPA: hypothetical protein VLS25_03465 [Dehalococcoidia bacterium]|nr:hypothetical protein [Dehalococcoidia bacterium]